jgi:predicted nucleic acid-binding protein
MKLVDTSAWVEFLRQRGDASVKHAVARLIEADRAAMTCPIQFELLSGVRPEEEADLLRAFEFSCHVPFERNDWRMAAELERRLCAQGRTIPRNDLFVATVALRAGLTVLCRDAHFDSMQEALGDLKVEQV